MSNSEYLFVYGTLRPEADHPMGALLRDGAHRVGEGHIRARLYMIDDPEEPGNRYPGAVPSGYDQDQVEGTLYALHDAHDLLTRFDVYEACDPSRPEPHEFLRRTLPVQLQDGTTHAAACYCYAWDLSRATPIPSGRFADLARDTR